MSCSLLSDSLGTRRPRVMEEFQLVARFPPAIGEHKQSHQDTQPGIISARASVMSILSALKTAITSDLIPGEPKCHI